MSSGSDDRRLVPRLAAERLAELAKYLRIVMVSGPRQSGKTTLLREYLATTDGSYRTLDRADTLRAAHDDPAAFVAYGDPPRVIDEVQLGGDEIVRAIKVAVDTDPRPSRFILSGSSRFLTIPTLSESLAGRLAFVELWPLSMAERTTAIPAFLNNVFDDPSRLVADSAWTRPQYLGCVTAGGYPEMLGIGSAVARRAWYDGYLSTVINRDIRDFATITRGDALSALLRVIAARAGSIAVLTDLAQSVELARETTRNYLSYLDMVYLTTSLPAWSTNLTSRSIKTPKLYPTDSGLAAHLLGVDEFGLAEPGHLALGPLVETFVATELLKATAYHDQRVDLFHLRTADKREIDFVLEDQRGRVVAIEVKASTSPGADALRGLRWLRGQLGPKLRAGVLLHLGTESASRGDGIYTMPVSVLWNHQPLP
ncbi:MAG TPA: ATP-binding protein [Pseudonocardiaceae bacterium]|nr:ATP-binding protein [Pseudonocardiaceae bacterium]